MALGEGLSHIAYAFFDNIKIVPSSDWGLWINLKYTKEEKMLTFQTAVWLVA